MRIPKCENIGPSNYLAPSPPIVRNQFRKIVTGSFAKSTSPTRISCWEGSCTSSSESSRFSVAMTECGRRVLKGVDGGRSTRVRTELFKIILLTNQNVNKLITRRKWLFVNIYVNHFLAEYVGQMVERAGVGSTDEEINWTDSPAGLN